MATTTQRDSFDMPTVRREAPIVAGSLDRKARTFDVVWTSGAEVLRRDWWSGERWIEALEVSEKAIRLDRLNSGRANVLNNHSTWSLDSVIGVVDRAWIEKGEGKATVCMSGRDEVAGLVDDIEGGIIRNISCGYITHTMTEEVRDGMKLRRATDWEPVEISFVAVPADPDAGMRSAAQREDLHPCRIVRVEAGVDTAAIAARMRMRQMMITGS